MSTYGPITRTDIAELCEALGAHARAEIYRSLDEPDTNEVTADEISEAVGAVLDGVADGSTRAKHDDGCWRRHAPCLADRVREVLT